MSNKLIKKPMVFSSEHMKRPPGMEAPVEMQITVWDSKTRNRETYEMGLDEFDQTLLVRMKIEEVLEEWQEIT